MKKGSGKEVKKEDIVVLPVWLGARLMDYSDLRGFSTAFWSYGKFQSYGITEARDVDWYTMEKKGYMSELKRVIAEMEAIEKNAIQENKKLAIVFMVTSWSAEARWFLPFMRVIERKFKNAFVCKIIMTGGFSNISYSKYKGEKSQFWPEEQKAHELGAVYSYYNSDAPTAGSHRVVELINRIVGADLLSDNFPDYSFEDLTKIAWNISRESFNAFGAREGSIPKYEIVGGRPAFAF